MTRLAGFLFLALCLPGWAGASPAASLARAYDALRQGQAAEAARLYRDLAEQGVPEAQFNLALLYFDGQGLPQNHAETLYWAWRARLSGRGEALALLARTADLATPDLRFVHLHGDRALLAERLQARRHDYMPPTLLDSQLRTLEIPTSDEAVLTLDIAQPLEQLVAHIEHHLQSNHA